MTMSVDFGFFGLQRADNRFEFFGRLVSLQQLCPIIARCLDGQIDKVVTGNAGSGRKNNFVYTKIGRFGVL